MLIRAAVVVATVTTVDVNGATVVVTLARHLGQHSPAGVTTSSSLSVAV